jgi:hypothetical protein
MHLGETRRASQGLQAQWSEVERFCLDQRILEVFLSFGNESVMCAWNTGTLISVPEERVPARAFYGKKLTSNPRASGSRSRCSGVMAREGGGRREVDHTWVPHVRSTSTLNQLDTLVDLFLTRWRFNKGNSDLDIM